MVVSHTFAVGLGFCVSVSMKDYILDTIDFKGVVP